MTTDDDRSGRARFKRHEPLLRGLTALLALAPRAFREWLWRFVEGWRGVAGVSVRYCLLKSLAKGCGANVYVGPYVELRCGERLVVGANVSIHRGCLIDATGGVAIGDDVSIAHASTVLSTEHTWDDASTPIKYNPVRLAAVRIENDVWIGCGCRILAGVTIRTRSVVAAGAVVAGDVEGGVVVAGVPARVVKSIGAAPAGR